MRARYVVGQMTAEDYAKKDTRRNGFADRDRVTLKTLAPVVDFHCIHRARRFCRSVVHADACQCTPSARAHAT